MNVRNQLGMGVFSLDEVRDTLGVVRPAKLHDLLVRFAAPIDYHENLDTPDGLALGGHYTVHLERDGTFRFAGDVRATGFQSFDFSLRVTAGAELAARAVMTAGGRVHGTNEPFSGQRQVDWDQRGQSPQIALNWLDFKRAKPPIAGFERDVSFFGDIGHVVKILAELYASYVTAGVSGECIMLGAAAADEAGLDKSLAGLVGVEAAEAVLLVFGDSAIVLALVAGMAVGVAVDTLIRHRSMLDDEFNFADKVFKGTLPRDRVVLTNLFGIGGRPFTIPVGNLIMVNLGAGFDHPREYTGYGDPDHPPIDPDHTQAAGQLFIHELTHAWQIAHNSFMPGFVCNALDLQVRQAKILGHDVYAYGRAGPSFSGGFNLEQQASIVDQWFGGSKRQQGWGPMKESDDNPYFRYIRDNIRANTTV
jgi:hypothetical protein